MSNQPTRDALRQQITQIATDATELEHSFGEVVSNAKKQSSRETENLLKVVGEVRDVPSVQDDFTQLVQSIAAQSAIDTLDQKSRAAEPLVVSAREETERQIEAIVQAALTQLHTTTKSALDQLKQATDKAVQSVEHSGQSERDRVESAAKAAQDALVLSQQEAMKASEDILRNHLHETFRTLTSRSHEILDGIHDLRDSGISSVREKALDHEKTLLESASHGVEGLERTTTESAKQIGVVFSEGNQLVRDAQTACTSHVQQLATNVLERLTSAGNAGISGLARQLSGYLQAGLSHLTQQISQVEGAADSKLRELHDAHDQWRRLREAERNHDPDLGSRGHHE